MDYTFNQRPADCSEPSHSGWEVIGWPTSDVGDCIVVAVCRDQDTAKTLVSALWNQQVPGQLAMDDAS